MIRLNSVKRNCWFLIINFATMLSVDAQFNVAGNATSTGAGCYEITNGNSQSGAVWNMSLIDLSQPFEIALKLNFGDNDGGADGLSFVLQPISSGVASDGSGVGYNGITPSIGVVMDDFQNPDDGDISNDHMSLFKNGNVSHGGANELVSVSGVTGFPANIEDGANHTFRFKWIPGSPNGTIQVWFDGVLSFAYSGDIVNAIFGGNPMVYWGVSGSTGGYSNVQSVCMDLVADYTAINGCAGQVIPFVDESESGQPITSYTWDFGDGVIWGPGADTTYKNPTHIYAAPGDYTVQLTVANTAGLISTTTSVVTIYPLPAVSITASPQNGCQPLQTTLSAISNPNAVNYVWEVENHGTSTLSSPVVDFVESGLYDVSLTVTDANGCVGGVQQLEFIQVHPKPISSFTITPEIGYVNRESEFSSINATSNAYWGWDFGDGQNAASVTSTTTHAYGMAGEFVVTHVYTDEFGCSDTTSLPYTVIAEIVVPNVFTPNNDGVNDLFEIEGLDYIDGAVLKIFNRWGCKVYESGSYKNNWDGGDFASGVYFYVLTLPEFLKVNPLNGTVTLLR